MKKDAVLSDCRRYRFALWRIWEPQKPLVMFIGLNPSTANESQDDPTLIRCINYAKAWGYGGVCTANLFAYRATDPKAMLAASDPVGVGNDAWLQKLAAQAQMIVAAWGNHGAHLNRSQTVRALLPQLHCLSLNRSGEPAHPLYQKANLQPLLWRC
ncbi:DUF1643 domain-containing protein [Paraferrimonas sedimenticola]|uniref:DUF1643 domain-containing protein n=1 Tax=Paraferrimonas sedimenticola TaxID=375674 RepID=A0AA37RTS3_9GAMM|nr:DUF1643 domain-containing protein [Paraferrimonas sedimenticola]GLP95136.1 hypothetical protein GCM10007895_04420 [Paraferrimonas sedimenticola]